MAETITSFYTFNPNTKARSSEVNTNFSNFRGSLIPVEENTQAASTLSHNLGAVDHWWLTAYTKSLHLSGSTGGWYFTPTTTGDLYLGYQSVTMAYFNYNTATTSLQQFGSINYRGTIASYLQLVFPNTTTSYITMKDSIDITLVNSSGSLFVIGESATGQINPKAAVHSKGRTGNWVSTGASFGANLMSNCINATITASTATTSWDVTNSTVTGYYTNRPIMFFFAQNQDTTGAAYMETIYKACILVNGATTATYRNLQLGQLMIERFSPVGDPQVKFSVDIQIPSGTWDCENISFFMLEI